MSTAYKCDKCLILFEPHEGDGEVTMWRCEKQNESRIGTELEWQLCADCIKYIFEALETLPK